MHELFDTLTKDVAKKILRFDERGPNIFLLLLAKKVVPFHTQDVLSS